MAWAMTKNSFWTVESDLFETSSTSLNMLVIVSGGKIIKSWMKINVPQVRNSVSIIQEKSSEEATNCHHTSEVVYQ